MPIDMPNPDAEHEFLAESPCPPNINCPKVARHRPTRRIRIVGPVLADATIRAALGAGEGEAVIEIDEDLYRKGGDAL